MANIDAPRGLAPVGKIVRLRKYLGNTTTDIFQGDVVQIQANGHVKTIVTTTGSVAQIGVANNFNDASASATAQGVWVYDHPDQEFSIQDDGASGTPNQDNVGATAVLVITAGSTTTGRSAHELDISGIGVAADDAVQILGFITGGELEIAKFATFRVKLKRHLYANAIVGI